MNSNKEIPSLTLSKFAEVSGLSNEFDYWGRVTAKAIDEINKQKDAIVRGRLSKMKLEHLLEPDQAKRRFKKLLIEKHPDREEWWVDDGSETGLKLVTFKIITGMDTAGRHDMPSFGFALISE